jgi:flagellar biosynthesis/type III secretory pathway protein FliH
MQQAKIQRFDFSSLQDFRGPIAIHTLSRLPQDHAVEVVPIAPSYTPHDLEQARQEGRKQGYQEGFASAQREILNTQEATKQAAMEAIAQLSQHLQNASTQYDHLLIKESHLLRPLVRAIAGKVAGAALNEKSEREIEAMVARSLPLLIGKPKASIELHPDTLALTESLIETQMRAAGFEGALQFRANEVFAPSDVRIEWSNGEITRNTAAIWREIDALLERIPLEITFAETLQSSHAASQQE